MRARRLCAALGVITALAGTPPAGIGAPPAQEQGETPLFRAQADAVILDLVVRDGKGRPVRDLRREEIRIFEDGVEQEVRLFRLRETTAQLRLRPSLAATRSPGETDRPAAADPPTVDPFRYLNLVSLVFDRLSLQGRRFARQGALDFLESGIGENTLVAVFFIDQKLGLVQPFTTDAGLIRSAIDRATSGEFSRFAGDLAETQQVLDEAAAASSAGSAATASIGRGNLPAGDLGGDFADAAIAEMTANMLRKSEELAREQQGIASIYALLALVGEQRRLAGRKTVLYFSEGLHVPPVLEDRFRFTISEANQANVSVYAVDARGLDAKTEMGEANLVLGRATRASRNQLLFGLGRAVTREQVMVFENAETSLRLNQHGVLADLAQSTGGFLIANTNDLRVPMRRLHEDLQVYYEAAYIPRNPLRDGKFRQIEVRVLRPEVTVQTRSGYFAMPPSPSDGPPLFPFEVPMLAALSSDPLPAELDFRFRILRFRNARGNAHMVLVAEIPLAGFTFHELAQQGEYRTRFSVLGLVKDQTGGIAKKISQDYPLVGPLEKLSTLKSAELVFVRQFEVPPGRYRVELAVHDEGSNRSGARRSFLPVPGARDGIDLSSLVVIRRVDPLPESSEGEDDNPFVVESGKIVPDLAARLSRSNAAQLSLFMVIYPDPTVGEEPQLVLQILRDGEVVAHSGLELPQPGARGEIPYIASLPLQALEAGRYEIRAVAQQGTSRVVEHAFFSVEP